MEAGLAGPQALSDLGGGQRPREVGAVRHGVGVLLGFKGSGVLEEGRGGQMLQEEESHPGGGACEAGTPGVRLTVGESLAAQGLSLPICVVGVSAHPHRGGRREAWRPISGESPVDRGPLPLPHAPLCTWPGKRRRTRFWVLLPPGRGIAGGLPGPARLLPGPSQSWKVVMCPWSAAHALPGTADAGSLGPGQSPIVEGAHTHV